MENKGISKKLREYALAFIETAQYDMDRAYTMLDDKAYSSVVFFSQQCVEKSIKASLEAHGCFEKTHDLSKFFIDNILSKEKDSKLPESKIDIFCSI
jgi:HEPN domain-containing protein